MDMNSRAEKIFDRKWSTGNITLPSEAMSGHNEANRSKRKEAFMPGIDTGALTAAINTRTAELFEVREMEESEGAYVGLLVGYNDGPYDAGSDEGQGHYPSEYYYDKNSEALMCHSKAVFDETIADWRRRPARRRSGS